jgi:hypothetical protein
MQLSDRRLARRFCVAKPLRFSVWNSSTPEISVESINISERGTYFETFFPPDVGATLRVRIEMPEEVTGAASAEWLCIAKVVRTVAIENHLDKVGVGIRLEFYEVIAEPASRTEIPLKAVSAGVSGDLRPRAKLFDQSTFTREEKQSWPIIK